MVEISWHEHHENAVSKKWSNLCKKIQTEYGATCLLLRASKEIIYLYILRGFQGCLKETNLIGITLSYLCFI